MRDDKPTYQERLKGIVHTERPAAPPPNKETDAEGGEASCAAFGYLRVSVKRPPCWSCDSKMVTACGFLLGGWEPGGTNRPKLRRSRLSHTDPREQPRPTA
jgi:hypothetical protein